MATGRWRVSRWFAKCVVLVVSVFVSALVLVGGATSGGGKAQDASFGNIDCWLATAFESNRGGAGYIDLSGPWTLYGSGQLSFMRGLLSGGSAATEVRAVIYADTGSGQPGSFVAVSTPRTIAAGQPRGWVMFTFTVAPSLAGGHYWLGYWYSSGQANAHYHTAFGHGRYKYFGYSATASPPPAYGSGTTDSKALCVLADTRSGPPELWRLPSISGTATEEATLTADAGIWLGAQSLVYQWQRCDANGGGCADIPSATAATYPVRSVDVGRTLRVVVTASNSAGAVSQSSQATALVRQAPAQTTLGGTEIGASANRGGAGYVDLSGPYALARPASVSKLSGYLFGGTSSTDVRAVIYADNGFGSPGTAVAASPPQTIAAGRPAFWVDFPFGPGGVTLSPGRYWLGYWYGGGQAYAYYVSVAGAGRYRPAPYSATGSPPTPYGGSVTDAKSFSLYATLGNPSPPVNTQLPSISGTPAVGETLTAHAGTWTGAQSFTYSWQWCNASGGQCSSASWGDQAYVVDPWRLGQTLRVLVTAYNGAGQASATSPATAVVQQAPVRLGRTTVGPSTNRGGTGYVDLSGPYTLAQAGLASKLSGYLFGGVSTTDVRAVIYADTGSGQPGAFVAATRPTTIAADQPGRWVDFAFATSPTLAAGSYWLGYWYGGGQAYAYYTGLAEAGRYRPAPYSATGNPPTPYGAAVTDTKAFSLYATVTG